MFTTYWIYLLLVINFTYIYIYLYLYMYIYLYLFIYLYLCNICIYSITYKDSLQRIEHILSMISREVIHTSTKDIILHRYTPYVNFTNAEYAVSIYKIYR